MHRRHTRVAVLLLGLLMAGCGTGGGGSTSSVDAAGSPPQRQGCARTLGLALGHPSDSEIQAALDGRFEVFNLKRTLVPPVDWAQDPEASHRYRQNLQKLRFLKPLLYAYEFEGNREALRHALALALDWVQANPKDSPSSIDAWTGKVVGDRVPYLGFLDSAARCEGLDNAASTLDASLADHGEALADPNSYIPDNHGLFVDTGLYLVTRYAPGLEQDAAWADLARSRFLKTLSGRVSEGVWLEHSCNYQFLVLRAVERFLADVGRYPALAALDRRMRAAAGWMVEPDRRICQFGDSYQSKPPGWAQRESLSDTGIRVFRDAGFAMVRAPEPDGGTGYLGVTDGFHNLSHKHADELSFELYDHGHRIVSDTGLYDKDPGPIRDFVLSSQAHSTLTVDGHSYPIADESAVYGSGLEATGSGAGWYAIEGRNEMLTGQGVSQHRLFLYRPGVALVIVDWTRAATSHEYDRYIQLGPDVNIDPAGAALDLSAEGFDGKLWDLAAAGPPATRTQVRGQRHPYAGFTSPDFRKLVARWTVGFNSGAANAVYATSISLDGSDAHAVRVAGGPGRATVTVSAGGAVQPIVAERSGDAVSIAAPGG
jgi:Heparinase II/III-like protein/Heparinase II/III N-terminus